MSSETDQKVKEMAQLSLLLNRINPIQEKNLKIYPLIFFDGIKSAKVDYDFSNPNTVDCNKDEKNLEVSYKFKDLDRPNFRVSYHLDIDESVDNSPLDKRFKAIEGAVRDLFWKETKVEVYFNTKLVYESNHV